VTLPMWTVKNTTCNWMQNPDYKETICNILNSGGFGCECPLRLGRFTVNDAEIKVDLNKIPVPDSIS